MALQTADASCGDDSGNIYVDCGNGTVTDNRTGLVWLKDANCLGGGVNFHDAMEFVSGLSDLPPTSALAAWDCGLADGSSPGEWRLPSAAEWEAMVADVANPPDPADCVPAITNDSGLGCWVDGPSSFVGVATFLYWTSTGFGDVASDIYLENGQIFGESKDQELYVWPVRYGQ